MLMMAMTTSNSISVKARVDGFGCIQPPPTGGFIVSVRWLPFRQCRKAGSAASPKRHPVKPRSPAPAIINLDFRKVARAEVVTQVGEFVFDAISAGGSAFAPGHQPRPAWIPRQRPGEVDAAIGIHGRTSRGWSAERSMRSPVSIFKEIKHDPQQQKQFRLFNGQLAGAGRRNAGDIRPTPWRRDWGWRIELPWPSSPVVSTRRRCNWSRRSKVQSG